MTALPAHVVLKQTTPEGGSVEIGTGRLLKEQNGWYGNIQGDREIMIVLDEGQKVRIGIRKGEGSQWDWRGGGERMATGLSWQCRTSQDGEFFITAQDNHPAPAPKLQPRRYRPKPHRRFRPKR